MMFPVAFLVACCLSRIAYVEADCTQGPFDGWKTIVGTGDGYFYIKKSTSFYENLCTYSQPPTDPTTERKKSAFKSGYKDASGDWQHPSGIAVGIDNRIIYIFGDKKKKYQLLYSDYRNCYVTYKPQELELWVHSGETDPDAMECCNKVFGTELRARKLQGTTLRKMDKDCSPYQVQ
uniref:Moubatin-like lipocalin n=1 Tax=Ornithodoros coriaceus TaxID=92741 RepID=B2D276_ORNCO|nr:moubatin-like lipocalin [Ornithodoros coriaceus]